MTLSFVDHLKLLVLGIISASRSLAEGVESGMLVTNFSLQEKHDSNRSLAAMTSLRQRRNLAVTHIVGDCSDSSFATIGAALAAAGPGDTLHLCRGTFTEAVVIPQGKDVIIKGRGTGSTFIKSPYDTRYIVNALPGSKFTLAFLTLDGRSSLAETTSDNPITAGVVCDECQGIVKKVNMVNLETHNSKNPTPSYGVFARALEAGSNKSIKVSNCKIMKPTAGGIVVDGAGMSGHIQKNTITGTGYVPFPASGIQVSRQAKATVTLNTITKYVSAVPSHYLSSGILTLCTTSSTKVDKNVVDDNDIGVSLITTSGVDVTENVMDDNRIGLLLELQDARGACPMPFRVRNNFVNLNNIRNSTEHGIRNLRAPSVSGSTKDNLVHRNVVEGSGKHNIVVLTGRSGDYTFNNLTNAGSSGIYVNGGLDGLFDGNFIHGSGQYGILVDNGDSHSFDDNDIANSGVSRIQINGGTNIAGNDVNGTIV